MLEITQILRKEDTKMASKKVFSFKVTDDQFKTSSYTNPGGVINRCVKVAITPKGVAVRDSKDKDNTTLFFKPGEWNAFIKGVKENQFDR